MEFIIIKIETKTNTNTNTNTIKTYTKLYIKRKDCLWVTQTVFMLSFRA